MSAPAPNVLSDFQESFLLFIESVPDAMVLSDREGRVVLVNANTEKLFGYRRDELLGRKVEILLPPRFRVRHRRERAKYYSDPTTMHMGIGREVLGCRKGGAEFPVEIYLSPVEIRGERLVWSAIRDVSDREVSFGRVRIVSGGQQDPCGLISICAWCKKVRDACGSWQPLDQYIASHSETKFTHGLCVDCLHKLNPDSH
jgi:PAS domain S-box-containing protein